MAHVRTATYPIILASGGVGLESAEERAMEVRVCTGEVLEDVSEVELVLGPGGISCGQLLEDLLLECQLSPSRKGAWQLEEDWQGCSKSR